MRERFDPQTEQNAQNTNAELNDCEHSHESEIPIRVWLFDDGRHSSQQIAHLHLSIRQKQELAGENSFRNIYDSQVDLSDIPLNYLKSGGSFFVAENAPGSVAGFVGLKPDEFEPSVGILKRLAVMPEYRGRGVGHQLVGELVSWAKANNYKLIKLATGHEEQAYGIYERHGFREVGFNADSQDFLMEFNIENSPQS